MCDNKYVIIYYPFPFDVKVNIGSGVRMTNIYNAFIEYGQKNNIKVLFVSGNQKVRAKQLKEIKKLKTKQILYCYVELPNIPLLLSDKNHMPSSPLIDRAFFRYFKENNIPLGGFLRDIYWKFNEMYPLTGTKKYIMVHLNEFYLKFYKRYFDVLFLPSLEMNKHVLANEEKVFALPSGGQDQIISAEITNRKDWKVEKRCWKCIYVGSLHETAGTINLLKAFEIYNEINDNKIALLFVCRENEYVSKKEEYKIYEKYDWLKIRHLDSYELSKSYTASDFAIIPYSKNTYNDFAMPVKLFEYLSYGLPILSTNINSVSSFIFENNCGYIVEDDVFSINKGLSTIIGLIGQGKLRKKDILVYFQENHTWESRIKEIHQKLSEVDNRL